LFREREAEREREIEKERLEREPCRYIFWIYYLGKNICPALSVLYFL
jgi:hypothetical protein